MVVQPCGKDIFEIIPKTRRRIRLDCAGDLLSKKGYEVLESTSMVLTVEKVAQISIFKHGRMLLFPVKTVKEAEGIAKEIIELLKQDKGCFEPAKR